MKKFKENVKGITLMVLVVTIIILLILSSVAIKLSLDDKGVIKEAKEAVNKWDRGSVDEENQLSKLASDMRKLRNKTTGSGGSGDSGEDNEGPGEGVDKPLSGITGNERENTKTKDKYGNNIVVPAGFKIVNPEDDVTKGIVIEDESANDEYSKGNQYVWIPVTHVDGEKINTIKDNRGYEHTIELARYTFDVGDYDSSTQSYNGTGAIESKILVKPSFPFLTRSVIIGGSGADKRALPIWRMHTSGTGLIYLGLCHRCVNTRERRMWS